MKKSEEKPNVFSLEAVRQKLENKKARRSSTTAERISELESQIVLLAECVMDMSQELEDQRSKFWRLARAMKKQLPKKRRGPTT